MAMERSDEARCSGEDGEVAIASIDLEGMQDLFKMKLGIESHLNTK